MVQCCGSLLLGKHLGKKLKVTQLVKALVVFSRVLLPGVQPCAILVTCNAGTMEFEVRLIPYRACGTDIGLADQRNPSLIKPNEPTKQEAALYRKQYEVIDSCRNKGVGIAFDIVRLYFLFGPYIVHDGMRTVSCCDQAP
eukprot:1156488-Amphidinium_carterae.2